MRINEIQEYGYSRYQVVDENGNLLVHKTFVSKHECERAMHSLQMERKTHDYEQAAFNDHLGIKREGFYISEWLIVANCREGWTIYKGGTTDKTKERAIKFAFTDIGECINFCKFLNTTYSDYLPYLKSDNDLNIFAITKWTIPKGIRIWSTIEVLDENRSILSDLDDLKNPAVANLIFEKERYWKRSLNWEVPDKV